MEYFKFVRTCSEQVACSQVIPHETRLGFFSFCTLDSKNKQKCYLKRFIIVPIVKELKI